MLQDIDYGPVFTCKCPPSEQYQYLVMDGTVMGVKKEKVNSPRVNFHSGNCRSYPAFMYLQSFQQIPCSVPTSSELVAGSLHKARVLVSDSRIREQLAAIFKAAASGVGGNAH